MQPLVSILFPCYNAEKYLKYSLESILTQDYQNLQILCINDGSTDSTLIILEKYKKRDDRIVIINNELNLGLIESLNRALKFISGSYFARMDADDYSTPNRISTQMKFMELNPEVDIVSSAYNYFEIDSIPGRYVAPIASKLNSLRFLSLFSTPLTHASILGKTSIVRSGQYVYDSDYPHAEDFELFSRLVWNGVRIATLRDSLYWVRIHQESVSAKYNNIQFQTNVKIIQRNIYQFLKMNISMESTIIGLLGCRIKNPISIKQMKQAFLVFDGCMRSIKQSASPDEIDEIKAYLSSHKLNMIVQANKVGFQILGLRNILFLTQSFFLLDFKQMRKLLSKMIG
ncbi:MAG: glycosyltransferase family 2 protein [Bacteroidota bacterium]